MENSKTKSAWARLFRSLILALLAVISFVATAQAQSPCEKELAEAEAQYQLGNLDEAIALADRCLAKSDLTLAERERSHLLLGRAYQAKRLLDNAKQHLHKLLDLIPNWRPDPENDKPAFRTLAEEVIKEREVKLRPGPDNPLQPPARRGSKKWLWIGGGAVAAGTAAFLISQGGGAEEAKIPRLPDPPVLPTK